MVRIINYSERTSEDGKKFFTLDVQGGIEMVKSKSTGNFYATARKTSITTTFDEHTCKALIGTEMSGSVEKEECESYEYTVKETGEVIELSHRFVFVPENEQIVQKSKPIVADTNVFSQNGILEPTM